MNSDVKKMLEMIDIIRGCQEQITRITDDKNLSYSERDGLIEGFQNHEERAKRRFEEAIISLIDERIKTIVGDR